MGEKTKKRTIMMMNGVQLLYPFHSLPFFFFRPLSFLVRFLFLFLFLDFVSSRLTSVFLLLFRLQQPFEFSHSLYVDV